MSADIDTLLARLEVVRQTKPNHWTARCPAHDDNTPSLSIKLEDNGKISIHDHGGCGAIDVLYAIGMEFTDLYPEEGYEKHRRRIKKGIDFHEHHLEICDSRRRNGHRLTEADKQAELHSFLLSRKK